MTDFVWSGPALYVIASEAEAIEAVVPGFASRYGCKRLVWHEFHPTMLGAIAREKRIKGGSRQAKIDLIERANPDWTDLYETLF
ncbi:hypothetical protein AiwAL_14655 [Acidiphilium sp. AL]|uniref:hypothetical protein n=1 Tax=Acidiphilium sp. AL TaxID=2871704 RepID=UPI0021CB2DA8|nr:hypothetical protein [Acidiphilium sp. AL]MCU4161327.1 hypothetical protein [Acidiphilium sp. AL]